MVPTVEDVTRELIRRFQLALGADADVYGASGRTAIEVTGDDGNPVVEVQDKPKLAIIGPGMKYSDWSGPPRKQERIGVSKNLADFSSVDAPEQTYYDLSFQLIGTAVRESALPTGQKEMLWLKHQVTLFIDGGNRLLGDGWDIYIANWPGYRIEGDAPKPMPTLSSSLSVFSAGVTVFRVVVSDGTQGAPPLVDPAKVTVQISTVGSDTDDE